MDCVMLKDRIMYNHEMADTMVIASDRSHLRKAYRYFLEELLNIHEHFALRHESLIQSLASNINKDRPQTFKLIEDNLKKGIRRIVIFTHADCTGGKGLQARFKKRGLKALAAQEARRQILNHFGKNFPELKVDCYMITVKGDWKIFKQIKAAKAFAANS